MAETIQSLKRLPLTVQLPAGAKNGLELVKYEERGAYAIRTWLSAQQHPAIQKEQVVEFAKPATWFQHFKHEHYPAWAKRLWPVEMVVETQVVKYEVGPILVCPHLVDDSILEHEKFLKGE